MVDQFVFDSQCLAILSHEFSRHIAFASLFGFSFSPLHHQLHHRHLHCCTTMFCFILNSREMRFHTKINWNRLQIHILQRTRLLFYVRTFICFFCPAKGYVNNKSKCLLVNWILDRAWEYMIVYVFVAERVRCIRNRCCNNNNTRSTNSYSNSMSIGDTNTKLQ